MCELMQVLWVVGESPSWVQSLAAVPALVKLQRRGAFALCLSVSPALASQTLA